jgi:pyrroloquinoline quinone (PQQ) biosynthesis protein C
MATKVVALKTKSKGKMRELEETLVGLAIAQHHSEAFKRLYAARFTKKGAQAYFLQHSLFNLNRRDCWGFVQGAAPMPVKRMVWDHEQGELAGDKDRGVADHYTLAVKQGSSFGLSPEDFYKEQPMDISFACFQAWINIARTCPWLEAAAASACLELDNAEDVIPTGCISRRIGEKLRDELGIPMKKQYSNAEHVEADVEHGKLIIELARKYGNTAEAREQIISGTEKSFAIERAFRGFTATLIEKYAKK